MRVEMTRNSSNQKGFTLIELLVAISLLAIGLLALASMQGVAMNANSIANRTGVGSSLAQQVAEELISRGNKGAAATLRNASASNTAYGYLDPVLQVSQVQVGPDLYTATYTVTPNTVVNNIAISNLTRVQVTVNYLPGGIGPGNVVGTFITNVSTDMVVN